MKINKTQSILIFGLILSLASCAGGGSSGTGEGANTGQVIDNLCKPLSNADLSQTGLQTQEVLSGEDGSFTIINNEEKNILLPTAGQLVSIDLSTPTCLILVSQDNTIINAYPYPADRLSSCTIEALEHEQPADFKQICN